jgi:hypothetical protein
MAIYIGPAVVVVEGDGEATVTATLVSAVRPDSPIPRWWGRLSPERRDTLWMAHITGWATLVVEGQTGDFRITAFSDYGPSEIEGIGPAPFW